MNDQATAADPNAAELRSIMDRHGLTFAQTAELLWTTAVTLKAWLRPPGGKAYRRCPKWAPELLALKNGDPSPFAA